MMVTIWDLETMQERVDFLSLANSRNLNNYHDALEAVVKSTKELNEARGRLKDMQREERTDREYS